MAKYFDDDPDYIEATLIPSEWAEVIGHIVSTHTFYLDPSIEDALFRFYDFDHDTFDQDIYKLKMTGNKLEKLNSLAQKRLNSTDLLEFDAIYETIDKAIKARNRFIHDHHAGTLHHNNIPQVVTLRQRTGPGKFCEHDYTMEGLRSLVNDQLEASRALRKFARRVLPFPES